MMVQKTIRSRSSRGCCNKSLPHNRNSLVLLHFDQDWCARSEFFGWARLRRNYAESWRKQRWARLRLSLWSHPLFMSSHVPSFSAHAGGNLTIGCRSFFCETLQTQTCLFLMLCMSLNGRILPGFVYGNINDSAAQQPKSVYLSGILPEHNGPRKRGSSQDCVKWCTLTTESVLFQSKKWSQSALPVDKSRNNIEIIIALSA